jgi:hypothetical protein
MNSLRVCVALLFGGGVVPLAFAQAPNGGAASITITTDRPAIADSSAVVPNGVFQAENGLLDTVNQARRTLDFPETLIRFGIGPSTELRFTAPDYYQDSVAPSRPRSGFADLVLGVKQQLHGVPGGFEVSVSSCRSASLPERVESPAVVTILPSRCPGRASSLQTGPRQECCPSMYRPKTARTRLSASPPFFWIDS